MRVIYRYKTGTTCPEWRPLTGNWPQTNVRINYRTYVAILSRGSVSIQYTGICYSIPFPLLVDSVISRPMWSPFLLIFNLAFYFPHFSISLSRLTKCKTRNSRDHQASISSDMDAIVELEDAESIRRRRGYVDIPWFFLMYFTCNCWSIC